MTTFFSPSGNPEVWDTKQDGYSTVEEWLAARPVYVPEQPTVEELFDRLRSFRDARVNSILWMRERHADELELGKEATLTPEQYTALLTYIQALRDIPAQPGAPWPGGDIPWPVMPTVGA